jgi:hypothetical protein
MSTIHESKLQADNSSYSSATLLMSLPNFIEIHDDPPVFNEAAWIGKGQQYPKAAGEHF